MAFLSTVFKSGSKYLLLITLFVTITSHAVGSDQQLTQLQNKAKQLQLWKQPQWLNLLHFEGDSNSPNDYISQVSDKNFYIAKNGTENPETELLTTLAGFYDSEVKGNFNAQCRFVARLDWLKQKLAIDPDTLPTVHCEEYIEWRKSMKPEQVSLIFPTYHLNSPSSMFGHTLLRIDPIKDQGDSKWLSVAVNFGANIPDGENSLLYAYRGLAGGYPGTFNIDHYFKKIQEYNRLEHRDIWEYQLNLTPEETERMVKHIWELKNINFDYYFFDKNCSYRLLELLEVARPEVELTDDYIVTAIPIDTVKTIYKANMIENVEYRPASATVLSYMLQQIPEKHHDIIIRLSEDIKTVNSSEFSELDKGEQRNIVEVAYKYIRYQQSNKSRDPETAKLSFKLLQLLNTYPAGPMPSIPVPVSPENGHHSKRISFGSGKRNGNYYGEIDFKMSFHDLEDNIKGFLKGAQINMGKFQIRAEENETIRLYRLDLIDIFSLAPRTQFFKPVAWKVYTGFERQLTKGIDQLTTHVTGGSGGNWDVFGNSQIYALATGRLEINKQLNNTLEPAIGFMTGLLSHFNKHTARFEISGEHFKDSIYRLRAQYTHNFVINTNNSLKIFAKHEWQEDNFDFSDVNISYQHYF